MKNLEYAETEIAVGSLVRSFDFENNSQCFVDGWLEGIEEIEGCDRYRIRVINRVFDGEALTVTGKELVYPPVNGTRSQFGRVLEGVMLLQDTHLMYSLFKKLEAEVERLKNDQFDPTAFEGEGR